MFSTFVVNVWRVLSSLRMPKRGKRKWPVHIGCRDGSPTWLPVYGVSLCLDLRISRLINQYTSLRCIIILLPSLFGYFLCSNGFEMASNEESLKEMPAFAYTGSVHFAKPLPSFNHHIPRFDGWAGLRMKGDRCCLVCISSYEESTLADSNKKLRTMILGAGGKRNTTTSKPPP